MINVLLIIISAYLAVLVQVGIFGAWPLLGGQPNLIALGSIVFLFFHRPVLGLWWIVVGGSLIDLLTPARFGSTVLPLLVAYVGVAYATRRETETLSWWLSVVFSLLILLVTELPLTIYTQNWHQLALDVGAAIILMVPVCTILSATKSSNRIRHVAL
jgi:hypothetical protein